jgi:hypothetical protein
MAGQIDEDPNTTRIRELIRQLHPKDSQPYEVMSKRAKFLIRAVQEEIAKLVQEPLNAAIEKMPHATYEEKKNLSMWINRELRSLGLSIRCSLSGQPCMIYANTGRNPLTGRFRYYYTDNNGRPHTTVASVSLPTLELIPDDFQRSYHKDSSRSR